MKFSTVLPLAALSTAFVLPDEQVLRELEIEDHHHEKTTSWYDEVVATKDDILNGVESTKDNVFNEFESVKDYVLSDFDSVKDNIWSGIESTKEELASTKDDLLSSFEQYFQRAKDTTEEEWSDVSKSSKNVMDEAFSRAESAVHSTANDMQSWFNDEVADTFVDHHHNHTPNKTVYELIAASNYTKTLAKLISEYPDLVSALNSTEANYTLFAPTDKAFEKIPDHAPKPSKEQLKAILSYHVLPDVYTAGRVLYTYTAPTLLKSEHLSSKPEPQRVNFKFTLRGLTVNAYSRIIAVNILGTNGVIHGVDSILLPPPKILTIIDLFPTEFSTLELGLGKTGLLEKLNTTHHAGGTFFAASNSAFSKLGPRINAFLFSKYGEKYLKALLEYHVVPDHTLYSDAYYKAGGGEKDLESKAGGYFHVDLPTLLKDRHLSVDIARYGGFISIKINGFSSVSVQDGVAEDGVLHVVRSVLIPPKQVGGEEYAGGELSVEELKERLEPFVKKADL